METEVIKKFNKASALSFFSLLLMFVVYFGFFTAFEKINFENESIRNFDWFVFWHTGWQYSSLDLTYYIPTILAVILLATSIYFGIVSIRKPVGKGRMLGIVSLAIASFVAFMILIFSIFPLSP